MIARGHPILINNREVLPEELEESGLSELVQLEQPTYVYTLITESRSFVEIQGVPVGTWCQVSWENFVANDERASHLSWSNVN